jgi:hypothetical protein
MQWRCKQAFLRIDRPCFLRGPCKVVIEKSSVEAVQCSEESSFEMLARQDMSLRAEELNSVDSSELAAAA